MKKIAFSIKFIIMLCLFNAAFTGSVFAAETFSAKSPDNKLSVTLSNYEDGELPSCVMDPDGKANGIKH